MGVDGPAGAAVGALAGAVGLVIGWFARGLADQPSSSGPAKKKSKQPAARRPAITMQPREELKMVLCVNQSLGMGKGKIGAQCAHAAVGVIQQHKAGNEAFFRMWERCGQPKITLKIRDEAEMAELAQRAVSQRMPCYIVHDAGRTQIAAGSQTVLAIGPAYKSELDRITGHLSLL